MLNHAPNVHNGHGEPYPRRLQNDVPNRKWLLPGGLMLTVVMTGLLQSANYLTCSSIRMYGDCNKGLCSRTWKKLSSHASTQRLAQNLWPIAPKLAVKVCLPRANSFNKYLRQPDFLQRFKKVLISRMQLSTKIRTQAMSRLPHDLESSSENEGHCKPSYKAVSHSCSPCRICEQAIAGNAVRALVFTISRC